MSEQAPETQAASGPSDRRLVLSATGWIGAILIFVVILAIAYYPNRPDPISAKRATERSQIVAEVTAAQVQESDSFGWVNQPDGIVRIPVNLAMERTVEKYQKGDTARPRPSDVPVQAAGSM